MFEPKSMCDAGNQATRTTSTQKSIAAVASTVEMQSAGNRLTLAQRPEDRRGGEVMKQKFGVLF